MKEVISYFEERKAEFGRHMAVARLVESRVDDAVVEDNAQVEVRHVNTLKSGLLIHLYNIVEAVTTRTLDVVARTIVEEHPKHWTNDILKEWVRAKIWDGGDNIGETAIKKLTAVGATLAAGNTMEPFQVKGEPGSWDDKAIKKVAARLGCKLNIPRQVREKAFKPIYLNETTAMDFLASRRNAIAHGSATFEDGAREQTLDDIEELAGRILPLLKAVADSYEAFLERKGYLVEQGIAA